MAHGTRPTPAAVAGRADPMTRWGILVGLLLVPVALSGCAGAVIGGILTAYDVTTTAVGIGQRNQAQDTQENLIEEIKGMRADFRQAGWVKDLPLPISEAARDREIEAQANPARRSRSLWERLKRMAP